jgi:hypothetical protein
MPEGAPAWLWGQGSPAAFAPFTIVNKGSLYSEVNAPDDDPHVWMKVDEGGDAADWVRVGNVGVVVIRGILVDISVSDSEQVLFNAVTASEVLELGCVYQEATGTTGAADGDFTVGTASGGGQIATADPYDISKAAGSYQAGTVATAALAVGDSVFWSHDQAASAAGTYYPQMKIRVEV